MDEASRGRGRGRGLALLDILKKTQQAETANSNQPNTEDSAISQESTAGPTPCGSEMTATTVATSSMGGRRRIAMMLAQKQAEDSAPSINAPTARGIGRGLKLLENLKCITQPTSPDPIAQGDIKEVTQQLASTSIGKTQSPVGKRNYYKEVKDTPPVVKIGSSGTPCSITANFIRLNFKENNVYEYEVKYDPDQEYKHLRNKLLYEHNHLFKECTFDGSILYIPNKLPDDITKLTSKNPYDDSQVTLTIIFKRNRRLSEMIHIYNVLFKHIMRDLKLVRFGRQHFNEHAAIMIPQHQLQVWPGYVTAVDDYEGGLMLTLDSTHKVLRTQTVLSLIKTLTMQEGGNWKKSLNEVLVGCSIMTNYNNKFYRVDSIDFEQTPRSTFAKPDNGKEVQMSFLEYYKNTYGIEIKDWDQPLLISRKRKLVQNSTEAQDFMFCLIPELCQMTGLTDDQRSNFNLMKDVATYTRITPNQRHHAFKEYIKSVMNNERAVKRLAGWGLSIAPETVDLTGRTLAPEALYFGNNIQVAGKPRADWNVDVTKHPVMQGIDILKWAILFTKRDDRIAMSFVETFIRCSQPMGILVRKPELITLPSDNTGAYVNALRKCISGGLQLVVTICPNARDDRYSAIKKICCGDTPIPSQVINARTLKNQQKVRAITQKIALQINCKLGGTLWHIAIPLKSCMVIGIDSYHDASHRQRSVCAFVASYNQSLTHWYSRAVFQDKGQEYVDSLKTCFIAALTNFLQKNGTLPDKIIVYRDGVGDGQLQVVTDYEVPQFKICCPSVSEGYQPDLTYVVVQKRINTRIFLKLNGELENPAPGTVLDNTVTRRNWFDFLIVSQKVNQGTVTPSHYIVVHDDSGLTPDQCQRLTYKLCHLYYNWPGTIRVPAPCQYAHKLAYLVGQCTHQSPSEQLADKLFFL